MATNCSILKLDRLAFLDQLWERTEILPEETRTEGVY